MVGGNDQAAVRRNILHAYKLDVPEEAAEESNNGPEYLQGPLREHCASACARTYVVTRRCAVDAQGKLSD